MGVVVRGQVESKKRPKKAMKEGTSKKNFNLKHLSKELICGLGWLYRDRMESGRWRNRLFILVSRKRVNVRAVTRELPIYVMDCCRFVRSAAEFDLVLFAFLSFSASPALFLQCGAICGNVISLSIKLVKNLQGTSKFQYKSGEKLCYSGKELRPKNDLHNINNNSVKYY